MILALCEIPAKSRHGERLKPYVFIAGLFSLYTYDACLWDTSVSSAGLRLYSFSFLQPRVAVAQKIAWFPHQQSVLMGESLPAGRTPKQLPLKPCTAHSFPGVAGAAHLPPPRAVPSGSHNITRERDSCGLHVLEPARPSPPSVRSRVTGNDRVVLRVPPAPTPAWQTCVAHSRVKCSGCVLRVW